MGYSLYIHRSENWFDENPPNPISYEDWDTLANSDTDLVVVGTGRDTRVNFEIKSFGWPSPEGKEAAFHWFPGGTIEIESRSEAYIPKAYIIAQALGAELQGDDGEFYRADGSSFHRYISEDKIIPAVPEKRSFFSKLFRR